MRFLKVVMTAAGLFLFAQSAWAKIDTVRVQDFRFIPGSLTIQRNDTVVWKVVQQCCLSHTVTRDAAPMSWDSGPLTLGGTFQLAFPSTGTFGYFCSAHVGIGMIGSITVQPPPPPVTALNWLGLFLLGGSLAAASIWILQRKRKTALLTLFH